MQVYMSQEKHLEGQRPPAGGGGRFFFFFLNKIIVLNNTVMFAWVCMDVGADIFEYSKPNFFF